MNKNFGKSRQTKTVMNLFRKQCMICDYPFREESIVNIDSSDNQSNDEKYYLEIFGLHSVFLSEEFSRFCGRLNSSSTYMY